MVTFGLIMKQFCTYIIQSESTGRYYIGHTQDIEQRLAQHNTHSFIGSSATKRIKGPWKVVYSQPCNSRSDAMKLEKKIKSWKSKNAIDSLIKSSVGRVPILRD